MPPGSGCQLELTTPLDSVVVVIANGGLTVMLRLAVALCCGVPESVTLAVKLNVPAVVGVPVMAPVLVLRFSPGGRLPV